MKSKQEIMESYLEEGKALPSDGALSMLTVFNLLEVLIDIRDVLQKQLTRIDTTETRFI